MKEAVACWMADKDVVEFIGPVAQYPILSLILAPQPFKILDPAS